VVEPYAVWLDRDVVAASGRDAATFLQGQLSQDTLALPDGGSAWSWLLAPTGKVDALVRVSRLTGDDWVIDTDRGWGDAVITRLTRFKLRTKVELTARPWPVLGLRGAAVDLARAAGDLAAAGGDPGGASVEPAGAAADPASASGDPGGAGRPGVLLAVPAWPGLAGVDLIGPAPVVPDGWPVTAAAEYEAVRIGAGIPRMGAELTDKTIPGETGLIEQTVSFTKGCYTGQELVARIDSRGGHVARRLRLLSAAARVEPGTPLVDGSGANAGMVTSVASSGTAWVALGYVRRGVEVPATLRGGPDGPDVEVRELPGGPAGIQTQDTH
jgi:folate-binding protein YgfZ